MPSAQTVEVVCTRSGRVRRWSWLKRVGFYRIRDGAASRPSAVPVSVLDGTVLVGETSTVADELSGPILAAVSQPANSLVDGAYDAGSLGGCWAGMLNEFRNHLTIFMAGTSELSATLPGAVAVQFADRLDDMEASAEFLQTLLVWMDTSISGGASVICDVGEVFRRTETLATAGLPSRTKVRFEPKPAGVRNRGAALECALAALITELGRLSPRASDPFGPPGQSEIRVWVAPVRGALTIFVETSAQHPRSPGWRVTLAKLLVGQLGGALESLDGSNGHAGFSVRFRFK